MIQFDRKPWCLWLLNFMTTVVACYLSKVPYLNSLDRLKEMCLCLTYMTNFRIFQCNRKHSKIVHTVEYGHWLSKYGNMWPVCKAMISIRVYQIPFVLLCGR